MTASDGLSAVEQAGVWLRHHLAGQGGTVPVREALAAALAAGHRGRTVRRAARDLGVETIRTVFGGPSTWSMVGQDDGQHDARPGRAEVSAASDDSDALPADDAPTETTPLTTRRVPTSRDIYGRPTEYVQVSSPQAASHWDERQWERLS